MKIKKSLAAVLFFVLCACLTFVAVSCAEEAYTVTFDVKGHGVAPQAITNVKAGSTVQKPEDPSESGYKFLGWYRDDDLDTVWNFEEDAVTENVTLYASWVKTHKVAFDVKGHGTAPADMTDAVSGSTIVKPEDPSEDGYVFFNWYKDEECRTLWNFYTDKVNEDTVLYAGWKTVFPVTNEKKFEMEVKDTEYFSVPETGSYTLYISDVNGKEGDVVSFRLDDETKTAVLSEKKEWAESFYLKKGVHKLSAVLKSFNIKVSLESLDTPFTKIQDFAGENYALKVNALGLDASNKKFSAVNIKFGKSLSSLDAAKVVDFDGELYTLEISEFNGVNYSDYSVKIKINFVGGAVSSIDVYAQTGEAWGNNPADRLEVARTAKQTALDLKSSENGELNSGEVAKTFRYVYFFVAGLKDKWLEFSGFAAGTEFYWVDVDADRTGDLGNKLEIIDGKPVRLNDDTMYNYLDYIAVKPASGAASVSFTVKEVDEPAPPMGTVESNPVILTVGEAFTMECERNAKSYFTFTVEEAGKYKITAYWEYFGSKNKVTSGLLDGVTDYLLFPPTPDQFLAGYEKEYSEAGEHTLVIASNSSSVVVLVEKVEAPAGGISAGTYIGSVASGPFTYEFSFVIDASNTVTVTKTMLLGGSVFEDPVTSGATQIIDNGGSFSVTVLIGGSFSNFVFTPSADGNSLNVTGDYTFTAAKQ